MKTVAFVCVRNAGRSQMATAFAERETERRDADIEIITGGTEPTDEVHGVIANAMEEVGLDIRDRTPREITPEELEGTEYVITMGCDGSDLCPVTFTGDSRDWELDDPGDVSLEEARKIRDDIDRRVTELFEDILTDD